LPSFYYFSISSPATYVSGLATYVSKLEIHVLKLATKFLAAKIQKSFLMEESF
jgi:hypothetical protein